MSYDGLTDPLGQSQVLPYLINLSELNYKITILSAEKRENLINLKNTITNICKNANINWEFIIYSKTPPILSTIKDVEGLFQKAKQLYSLHHFEIIHCRSYIAAMVGLRMKRKLGVKFLFDMRGFWADERVDGGIWKLSNPFYKRIYKFFKNKEKEYLKAADHIISLTYNGKKEIESWEYFDSSKENITVIPCCADLNHFDFNKNFSRAEIKSSLGIPEDNKVITYLGSIGTWYMLDEMLDYFKIHVKKHPKTSFLWITKDNSDSIISGAKERGIFDNIVIKGSERANLPLMLSVCDASIFFIKPLFSKKASSPTKKAELLGMGVPLICNSNVGDTEEIVKKENVGLVVEEFNEKAYLDVVNSIEKLYQYDRSHLREVAQKYFSLKDGVKNYSLVYQKLMES